MQKKIAAGAIFRNEVDYIIEWIAWHQICGLSSFYIADNYSDDGTKELLDNLEMLGIVETIYQPPAERFSQIKAYDAILQRAHLRGEQFIIFIDADEFLISEDTSAGSECDILLSLFENINISAVCINWRTFGSSNLTHFHPTPVLKRFSLHQADHTTSWQNHHVKTVARIDRISQVGIHVPQVSHGDFYSPSGVPVHGFLAHNGSAYVPSRSGGLSEKICSRPLRINHYPIKSKEEYTKKRLRGDAMLGTQHDRGEIFFVEHDFRDKEFRLPDDRIALLEERIDALGQKIDGSLFRRKLIGSIDFIDGQLLTGWVLDEADPTRNLTIQVFINSELVADCGNFRHRGDLMALGLSGGNGGFSIQFPVDATKGDLIEIKVKGNQFKFPNSSKINI